MKRYLLSILAAGTVASALAVPAKPGKLQYTQPDGSVISITMRGDEFGRAVFSEDGMLLVDNGGRLEIARFDKDGFPVPSGVTPGKLTRSVEAYQTPNQVEAWLERIEQQRLAVPHGYGLGYTPFPLIGEPKALVVLVEYQDVKFKYGDFQYFNDMLNKEGFTEYGAYSSARDWFVENSNGLFRPQFDVYGPVTLPETQKYYGANDSSGNDACPWEMAIHACDILDDDVDFSQYDLDGDGYIDNVFVFYAGKGEADGGGANTVWPHSWDIEFSGDPKTHIYDGVILNHYACTNEYPSGWRRPDGICTFVHEFSHVLGLPDLYQTSSGNAFTPGEFSVLDIGSYNNDGLTPPNYSSFERNALGWIDMKTMEPGEYTLDNLHDSNVAYAIATERPDEYFFFENRQQTGNDEFIPGHGMIVWHVDYKDSAWEYNTVNNVAGHQRVDIVEADGIKTDATRDGDPFPGFSNVREFGLATDPALVSWAKKSLGLQLSDITETSDGKITFTCTDPESGVGEIEADREIGMVYDLLGRRVMNPDKGIFIKDGKKIALGHNMVKRKSN